MRLLKFLRERLPIDENKTIEEFQSWLRKSEIKVIAQVILDNEIFGDYWDEFLNAESLDDLKYRATILLHFDEYSKRTTHEERTEYLKLIFNEANKRNKVRAANFDQLLKTTPKFLENYTNNQLIAFIQAIHCKYQHFLTYEVLKDFPIDYAQFVLAAASRGWVTTENTDVKKFFDDEFKSEECIRRRDIHIIWEISRRGQMIEADFEASMQAIKYILEYTDLAMLDEDTLNRCFFVLFLDPNINLLPPEHPLSEQNKSAKLASIKTSEELRRKGLTREEAEYFLTQLRSYHLPFELERYSSIDHFFASFEENLAEHTQTEIRAEANAAELVNTDKLPPVCLNGTLQRLTRAVKQEREYYLVLANLARAIQTKNKNEVAKIFAENQNLRIINFNFEGLDFQDLDFGNAQLINCNFVNCNLSGAKMTEVSFTNVRMNGCTLTELELEPVQIPNITNFSANADIPLALQVYLDVQLPQIKKNLRLIYRNQSFIKMRFNLDKIDYDPDITLLELKNMIESVLRSISDVQYHEIAFLRENFALILQHLNSIKDMPTTDINKRNKQEFLDLTLSYLTSLEHFTYFFCNYNVGIQSNNQAVISKFISSFGLSLNQILAARTKITDIGTIDRTHTINGSLWQQILKSFPDNSETQFANFLIRLESGIKLESMEQLQDIFSGLIKHYPYELFPWGSVLLERLKTFKDMTVYTLKALDSSDLTQDAKKLFLDKLVIYTSEFSEILKKLETEKSSFSISEELQNSLDKFPRIRPESVPVTNLYALYGIRVPKQEEPIDNTEPKRPHRDRLSFDDNFVQSLKASRHSAPKAPTFWELICQFFVKLWESLKALVVSLLPKHKVNVPQLPDAQNIELAIRA